MHLDLSSATSPQRHTGQAGSSSDTVVGADWINDGVIDRRRRAAVNDIVRSLDHELRTPLAVSRVVLELLVDPTLRTKDRHLLLRRLQANVSWMTTILDNLALWADMQDVEPTRSFKKISVHDWIADAVALAGPLQATRHQTVQMTCPDPPPWVFGNEVWLRQVVINLLVNASRYSSLNDTIEVRVSPGDQVRISVIDHGPGISKKDQAKLFECYAQGKQTTNNAVGGRGLGLFIVRTVVELHGGTVGVSSAPGHGTTVWLTLSPVVADVSATISEFAGRKGEGLEGTSG